MRFRLGKPAQVALFAEVPLLILAWWLFQEQRADAVAIDFTDAFLTAAHAVVHGHSPYPGLHSPSVAGGYAYVYPPLAAFVFAPFAVLPHAVAAWAATVVVVACFFGALHLFGVRDWRCYGVAILWKPSLFAIQTANLSLLLLLLAAIAWRKRSGAAVGAGVAAKLFVWPLLAWQLGARPRAALRGVATAALLIAVPWAILRFADAHLYLRLTRSVHRIEGPRGYTLAACGIPSWGVACIAAVLVGLILWLARRDERASFALAVVAALLLSPVVWLHYFVLLAAIVAVYQPRLSVAWFVPFVLWLDPSVSRTHQASHGSSWQLGLALVLPGLLLLTAMASGSRRVRPAEHGVLAHGAPGSAA